MAMAANQTSMTGPNIRPMRAVPRFWTVKRRSKSPMATGTTQWVNGGATTLIPSTAASTEMAGVMTPSP
jgi:hypothetical protein